MEWPAAGLALASVAVAVAHSRLHVGAHWFSDVAAGAAIGIAIALLGRVVFVNPASGPDDGLTGARQEWPAERGGRAAIVVVIRCQPIAHCASKGSMASSTIRMLVSWACTLLVLSSGSRCATRLQEQDTIDRGGELSLLSSPVRERLGDRLLPQQLASCVVVGE
jgi:hypothetical protein